MSMKFFRGAQLSFDDMRRMDKRFNSIIEVLQQQADDIYDLKVAIASIRGKQAVSARERKKLTTEEAERALIEHQLGGKAFAVKDEDGKIRSLLGEDDD